MTIDLQALLADGNVLQRDTDDTPGPLDIVATYVKQGAANTNAMSTLIGNRTSAAGVGAQLGLEVPVNFTDSNAAITQAASFFAFFSGNPGASQGTMQGGSSEASVSLTTAETAAALGFEGIVATAGTGGSLPTAIGLQGTAFSSGTCTVTDLVSIFASAPYASSGTPTITNAYSVKIAEPTVGTNKYSLFSVGRHRIYKGTPGNVLEIGNGSNTLQWSSDGTILRAYASDGTSNVFTVDPQDAATERALIQPLGAGSHGLTINHLNASPTGNLLQVQIQGSSKVAVLGSGALWINSSIQFALAGMAQTTVGAAGGASALPATPTKYFKIVDSAGTTLVVPAYAAS